MTQPAYEDCRPFLDAGDSTADVAAKLSAVTNTDMPTNLMRAYFARKDLWLVDPATGLRLKGAIGEAYSGLTAPQQALVRKLQTWVYDQSSIETENNTDVAIQFRVIVDGLVNLSIIATEDRAAIGVFAGGLKYPGGVTDVEVQAAIDQQVVDDATAARRAACTVEVQRLKAGSSTANQAAMDYRSSADFTQDIDHVAATTAAYDAAFDPNA